MPELPEVEITRQGLLPLVHQMVQNVVIRNAAMRWPIPKHLPSTLKHQKLIDLKRRAKYILAIFTQPNDKQGTLLLHLGMSGKITLLDRNYPPEKHDHFDILFKDNRVLRLTDPRRFGAVLWTDQSVCAHRLLSALGPEPLSAEFNGEYLYQTIRTRTAPIKTAIMDNRLVVGVGNIYASESLFSAKINPQLPANKLSKKKCETLVVKIKATLQAALEAGGSSLRDFYHVDGSSGYFQQTYYVYGRANEPCRVCQTAIRHVRLGQRSTFYCHQCQSN